MLSKPLSLALVYVLTVANFLVLSLPFLMAIFPFMKVADEQIIVNSQISFDPKMAFFLLVFLISSLMLFYLFIDFLFGLSVRSALQGCKRYDRLKNYHFLDEIFKQVQVKFAAKNTKLYIKNSDEINAFAIGGIGNKAIVLTKGLIEHYAKNTEDNQQFLLALRSILGHEMSHLVNKDFLPGLIVIVNQKVTNFISGILMLLFKIAIQTTTFFRVQNQRMAAIILSIYNITDWILTFFNRHIVYNLYQFVRNFVSRSVEYRCDKQSAKAFGGMNMAFALSLLGKSGYFTLFSTHPATQRRIHKVEVVEEKNAIIRASILTRISNFIAILILPCICLYAAHLATLDDMVKIYLHNNHPQTYADLIQIFATTKKSISDFIFPI